MLKFKLEATSISSTVHVRRPGNIGGWSCRFKQVAETIGLLKTLDFVNFGGFRGFRFLDPPTYQSLPTQRSWCKQLIPSPIICELHVQNKSEIPLYTLINCDKFHQQTYQIQIYTATGGSEPLGHVTTFNQWRPSMSDRHPITNRETTCLRSRDRCIVIKVRCTLCTDVHSVQRS